MLRKQKYNKNHTEEKIKILSLFFLENISTN